MARNTVRTNGDATDPVATKARRASPSESTTPVIEAEVKPRTSSSATSKEESPPPVAPAAGAAAVQAPTSPPDVIVHIDVICGGITNVKIPVAIAPRYQGMPLAGAAKAFDRQLDSWLTRALELGMIGSGLGQLFPINLQRKREAQKVNVDYLLLVGMGEPGHFAQDDLRYLMSNVTVAVKSLKQHQFSTGLIGTRRNELPIEHAVRDFLEGILDGYERFRVIAEGVKDDKEQIQEAVNQSLSVALVESDKEKAQRIYDTLAAVSKERLIPGLQLEVDRGGDVPPTLFRNPVTPMPSRTYP